MREFGRKWCTDQATGMSNHEGHLLRSHIFRCDDQVTLVLARGGIKGDNEVPKLYGVECQLLEVQVPCAQD